MGTCENCGAKKSSVGTIIMVLVGVAFAGLIGVPLLLIALLVAVAAIGSSANEEFSSVSDQLHGAGHEEYQFSDALDHVPSTGFDSTAGHDHEDEFTAAQ